MENEREKDILIEHRFHKNIIGAKGEKIREIRDMFHQVRSKIIYSLEIILTYYHF
jgi:GTPase Era involved in 16S rRNA processing